MKTLTVKEAAKNLSNCVERVYCRHESFELVRNGVPRARLVPVNGTGCSSHELADDLASSDISYPDWKLNRAPGEGTRPTNTKSPPL